MGRLRHVEIAGRDGGGLRSFYGELFGWRIDRREIAGFDYYDIELEGGPSAGIRHEPEGEAEIVVYYEVADLERSVERAKELGAGVRIPPMEHGDLRFALLEDPEGNPVGLTEAKPAVEGSAASE